MLSLLTTMDQDFVKELQAVFPLRNKIVHGNRPTVSLDEATGVLEVARKLIEDYSFPEGP